MYRKLTSVGILISLVLCVTPIQAQQPQQDETLVIGKIKASEAAKILEEIGDREF